MAALLRPGPRRSIRLLLLLVLLVDELAHALASGGEGRNGQGLNALRRQLGGNDAQLFAVNRHVDRLFRGAAIDAAIGRDIAVMATDGHLHEVPADDAVVGGIESDPAG